MGPFLVVFQDLPVVIGVSPKKNLPFPYHFPTIWTVVYFMIHLFGDHFSVKMLFANQLITYLK
jgi:hypothetical protein